MRNFVISLINRRSGNLLNTAAQNSLLNECNDAKTDKHKGGGGGGGVTLIFFVKLDFEIAVDQNTRAHDRILPNHLNMLRTMLWGALLVATSLLSYEQNTICPYLDIRTNFDRFKPINWSIINIFGRYKLYMKGKPILHSSISVDSVVTSLSMLR